ncbi:RNA polymerase, sigma 28 subunit, FliA/WhiG subfamily [Desulfurobacterium thermolithotrophum DSM 11699]|uniref:RNA polymerase, sigma 28 subunit, FliA/WhiG subfamily n=1 Tax=Desulfurobacterium thermolithotrophum (strain DSM 11699 / BSA) TaxID=868864 RepID=F0S0Q9_DESTD|nr:sigma-70 family RNA polymerase sigma factor [Desulfurobacterium thermolithotrophum]ADY73862.1 RNA polymerase, sigma 28 subunit, FliA/WhiG subfamily [Desulfurobacterium thermolithotrophum DSM 11699]
MYTKSRKELIIENLPLVKKIANKIYRRLPENAVEFEELVNTGVIGLIKALDNYDKTKAKFSTYAYIKIRGEILDYLRKLDFLSRSARERIKNTEYYQDLKEEIISFVSLEENIFISSDKVKIRDILSSDSKTPEEEVILKEAKERLANALKRLSEKEQLILQLIFVEELDLKSISEIIGISISRVSQIKGAAIKKLSKYLKDSV